MDFMGHDQPLWRARFLVEVCSTPCSAGMADALGIEARDLNGVIRPIDRPVGGRWCGKKLSSSTMFPGGGGGAARALRLESEEELPAVLRAAHARVANCTCGESASCYTCLRSYSNQFCHDLLQRGPVAPASRNSSKQLRPQQTMTAHTICPIGPVPSALPHSRSSHVGGLPRMCD